VIEVKWFNKIKQFVIFLFVFYIISIKRRNRLNQALFLIKITQGHLDLKNIATSK